MPNYHGDITQHGQSFYRSDEGNKIVVAVILLLLLGYTGAHRFYLGETRFGMVHLFLLLATGFAIMGLSWTLAVTIFAVQGLLLFGELLFFFVRAVMGR